MAQENFQKKYFCVVVVKRIQYYFKQLITNTLWVVFLA